MSTAIAFRFPGGRYHATPWDAQVNEAAIEWPPSPWRILRALVATWHRKADRHAYPEPVLARLVEQLAERTPAYRLPPVTRAHARHYMPAPVRKTLVFDAFARVDPAEELIVVWPGLTLDEPERALLSALLGRMGYLGRAESWAEARLLEGWDGPINCAPFDRPAEVAGDNAPRTEPVTLIAPVPADDYSRWRQEMLEKLQPKGRVTAKQRRLLATLPDRLLDALRFDTAEIQAAGWNRPPGATFIQYRRRADAFRPRPRLRIPAPDRRIASARIALDGKPLPRIEDAVRIGEVMRLAAISKAQRVVGEGGMLPSELTGHDLPADATHGHAFYLPEDADGDGRIDHILVHAPAGLSRTALQALGRVDRLWRDGAEWPAVLESYGAGPDQVRSVYAGSGRVWTSVTPYLHPWHAKKGFGVREQVERECRERGLPDVVHVEAVDTVPVRDRERRPVHFHRFRTKHGLVQPDTRGRFMRITFADDVEGPLALGFGCHFGLGVFRVVPDVA